MKTVIEMALKAGFLSRDNSSAMYSESDFDGEICMEEYAVGERLKRFAELVRADEREACAKVCEEKPAFRTALDGPSIRETVGKHLAAAIRARSNT